MNTFWAVVAPVFATEVWPFLVAHANAILSVVTAAFSIVGLRLAKRDPRWGWRWGLGVQVVWAVAGYLTSRPGDIVLSVVFFVMYLDLLKEYKGATIDKATTEPTPEPAMCCGGTR